MENTSLIKPYKLDLSNNPVGDPTRIKRWWTVNGNVAKDRLKDYPFSFETCRWLWTASKVNMTTIEFTHPKTLAEFLGTVEKGELLSPTVEVMECETEVTAEDDFTPVDLLDNIPTFKTITKKELVLIDSNSEVKNKAEAEDSEAITAVVEWYLGCPTAATRAISKYSVTSTEEIFTKLLPEFEAYLTKFFSLLEPVVPNHIEKAFKRGSWRNGTSMLRQLYNDVGANLEEIGEGGDPTIDMGF